VRVSVEGHPKLLVLAPIDARVRLPDTGLATFVSSCTVSYITQAFCQFKTSHPRVHPAPLLTR